MFHESMVFFAFFLSTLLSTQKQAYTMSYAFVLLSVILELVLSNGLLTYFIFFYSEAAAGMKYFRAVFYTYPPFAYSLMFNGIARKAAVHFDDITAQWVDGKPFGFSDLAV